MMAGALTFWGLLDRQGANVGRIVTPNASWNFSQHLGNVFGLN